MERKRKIELLSTLGQNLLDSDWKNEMIHRAAQENMWFTSEMVEYSINSLVNTMLDGDKLEEWVRPYSENQSQKRIGIITAGNIPLVGFHDILSAFIAGHQSIIKLSSKDQFLMRSLVHNLVSLDGAVEPYFQFVDRMGEVDAVIATGSNNSYHYFEQYFKHIPHILRKNRSSIAILDGSENEEDLTGLAKDIFLYFGLGCRSISKIYIPRSYDLLQLRTAMEEWNHLLDHAKFKNNYDYSYAIYLMNKTPFYTLGPGVFLESEGLHSRISCIHYEYYDDIRALKDKIDTKSDELQCVVGKIELKNVIPFGQSQNPNLSDYADGINTLDFLTQLK